MHLSLPGTMSVFLFFLCVYFVLCLRIKKLNHFLRELISPKSRKITLLLFIITYYFGSATALDRLINIYRPQTKLRKGNVFTSVCQEFCPQEGGLPQYMLGYTPPLGGRPPFPPPADGYSSGRYASYWNAFLLDMS